MRLTGRRLLLEELEFLKKVPQLSPTIRTEPAMRDYGREIRCVRCGARHVKTEVVLGSEPDVYYYCSTCIQLGRVTSNQLLYLEEDPIVETSNQAINLCWKGQLSEAQKRISVKIKQAMLTKQKLLVNAVTGAGKTEMLFSGIEASLKQGQSVCLTSPRVDVCLELYPRLASVFPDVFINLLYGGQTAPYRYSPLVICTTHQLLRFYHAFDVLIVDEVDAFPLAKNQMLHYGITHCKKQQAAVVYLSATPDSEMLAAVNAGEILEVILPNRYHGFPLPEPKLIWQWQWQEHLLTKFNVSVVCTLLEKAKQNQRRLLIFCPNILWMHRFEKVLKKHFPKTPITSVYSADEYRNLKVLNMREGKSQWLLTTTILERGVTFSDIDVMVIGSNHNVYTEAALVQISGRVGRKATHPTGTVYFIHDGKTLAMINCIKRIKKMNRLANANTKIGG